MPRSVPARSADALLERINHHLNLYSMAAITAGVSALALVAPANAEVVVTKTNIPIGYFNNNLSLDLNKDGVKDFMFSAVCCGYDHSIYTTLRVTPLTGGEVVGGNRAVLGPYASALMRGADVGPSAHFSSSVARGAITVERLAGSASATVNLTYYGNWNGVGNDRFLGVKFLINGTTHYGWIRMTVEIDNRTTFATITAYAYETVANKKITVGSSGAVADSGNSTSEQVTPSAKGPSIGMLALGADGLDLWRRD